MRPTDKRFSSACLLHAKTDAQGGTFRAGIAGFDSGETLDPQVRATKCLMNLRWQRRNDLIEIGPGGVPVPEIATEWRPNDDPTVWTLKIREGVKFHNGKTLDEADVVSSVNLHRGEKSVSQSKTSMTGITDIKATGPHEVAETPDGPNASCPRLCRSSAW